MESHLASRSNLSSGSGRGLGGHGPNAQPSTSTAPAPPASSSSSAGQQQLRSCITCRKRKVRCDKKSPCSNCQKGQIPCVFPANAGDKPPRWARKFQPGQQQQQTPASSSSNVANPPNMGQVMNRLKGLEGLVKELSSQLEQANSTGGSPAAAKSGSSPSSSTQEHDPDASGSVLPGKLGRLVLEDKSQSRYVSSNFWSRINDELDNLRTDTENLAEEDGHGDDESIASHDGQERAGDEDGLPGPGYDMDLTSSEKCISLFGYNAAPPKHILSELAPLPSQILFLVEVFAENVNVGVQVVHIPTVREMLRGSRHKDLTAMAAPDCALLFAIFYAAVASMEDDDVMTNFGSAKSHLIKTYRLGVEYALAKADFLNVPDLSLVQAFTIFLLLARRHDSPRRVWMCTGLVIRMAQSLGLHRDAAKFGHLPPYEIEMRRRVWWAVCVLDLRASEDLGTELSIVEGTFDTQKPSSLNDVDITRNMKEIPQGREGVTDTTMALVHYGWAEVQRKFVAAIPNQDVEYLTGLIGEIWTVLDVTYLQHTTPAADIIAWLLAVIARLVMAKVTLIVFLPVCFASSEEQAQKIAPKLLAAAIEVAEYNHALNEENGGRNFRWLFQSYTHWHAIVYLLMSASKRPWSPLMERGWVALNSKWLIPKKTYESKNLSIWLPLRKLMAKARRHRNAEIQRLRNDPQAAQSLVEKDCQAEQPSSPPFTTSDALSQDPVLFRQRWRAIFNTNTNTNTAPMSDNTTATNVTTSPSINSLLHPSPLPGIQMQSSVSTANIAAAFDFNTSFASPNLTTEQPIIPPPQQPQQGTHIPSTYWDPQQPVPDDDDNNNNNNNNNLLFPLTAQDHTTAASMVTTISDQGGLGHLLWADSAGDASMDMGIFDNLDFDTESDGDANNNIMDWNNWVNSAIDTERAARINPEGYSSSNMAWNSE